MFDFDEELARRYGAFASYPNEASPALVEYYGENPAEEMDRLLDHYTTSDSIVLDVGCGTGHTLCRLAPAVKQIWGMDHNDELIAATRLRAARLGLSNVTTVCGNTVDQEAVAHLPRAAFDLAFSRRGPNFNAALMQTLSTEAIVVQELVSNFDGYPLGEIFGRRPYLPYNYTDQQVLVSTYAELGLFPISCKEYFYEEFFRDSDHLAAFLIQVWAMLSNWRLPRKGYDHVLDRAALDLYVRYNTTPKGIRLLRQRKIFAFRRTRVTYYPVDSAISSPS